MTGDAPAPRGWARLSVPGWAPPVERMADSEAESPTLPPGPKWRSRLYRGFMRVVFGFWPEPPRGWLGNSERRFWWRCRMLFGLRVGDVNSKFKLFRRAVFDRIEIQSDGEFVHAELLGDFGQALLSLLVTLN